MPRAPRLGVLASGAGSNLEALIDAQARGDLPARVVVVVSNNSAAGALARARAHRIPGLHISSRTHADPDAAILAAMRAHEVDVVVLAGYMKRVGRDLVAAFRERMVNIHPAPLPRFGGPGMYGAAVHEAVLAARLPESGPTVHLVDEGYDEGPVLGHRPVPVRADDTAQTLAARVLAAEHDLYWRVIRERFCAPP